MVANPTKFKKWFNVDVQENTEVTAIDRSVSCKATLVHGMFLSAAAAAHVTGKGHRK